MLKVGSKEESPYFYKVSMECFGRSIEFGVSRKEFALLKDKGARFLPKLKPFKNYFSSARAKSNGKKENAKSSDGEK